MVVCNLPCGLLRDPMICNSISKFKNEIETCDSCSASSAPCKLFEHPNSSVIENKQIWIDLDSAKTKFSNSLNSDEVVNGRQEDVANDNRNLYRTHVPELEQHEKRDSCTNDLGLVFVAPSRRSTASLSPAYAVGSYAGHLARTHRFQTMSSDSSFYRTNGISKYGPAHCEIVSLCDLNHYNVDDIGDSELQFDMDI